VLILCDLMLPDGSGFDLLQSLAESDAPSPGMHRVAFSAGVSAEARQRLQSLGVHEVLSKPASLAALLACVQGRRGRSQAPMPPTPAPVARTVASGRRCGVRLLRRRPGSVRELPGQCRQQWRHDAEMGDLALKQGDLQAMRRLAHSLKSVLTTLGLATDGALALSLEHAAAEGRAEAAGPLWPKLRAHLLACAASPGMRAAGPWLLALVALALAAGGAGSGRGRAERTRGGHARSHHASGRGAGAQPAALARPAPHPAGAARAWPGLTSATWRCCWATAAQRWLRAATRVSLLRGGATVQVSAHLPANPFGRWLNVELQLAETGGLPVIDSCRVGRLPLPVHWPRPCWAGWPSGPG
jgi:CheY-like chemotaxis protein